jgi:hypothetical protein
MTKIAVLEAAHYGEARARFANDEIVRAMAEGLRGVDLAQLEHEGGGARFEFLMAANDEYEARGGTDRAHLGAIAEALLMILKGEA